MVILKVMIKTRQKVTHYSLTHFKIDLKFRRRWLAIP